MEERKKVLVIGVISFGSMIAALSKAAKVIVKTPHEAVGIPTMEANAEGLRCTKQVVNMLCDQDFNNEMNRIIALRRAKEGKLSSLQSAHITTPYRVNGKYVNSAKNAEKVDASPAYVDFYLHNKAIFRVFLNISKADGASFNTPSARFINRTTEEWLIIALPSGSNSRLLVSAGGMRYNISI